jgi:anti-anti-sigma regulatory factor
METSSKKNQAVFDMPGKLNRQINEVDFTLANGSVDLILDFGKCDFISVEGLEWLEELLLRADSRGIAINFKNVKPPVYKVFKVSRLDSVLKACGSAAPSGPVC